MIDDRARVRHVGEQRAERHDHLQPSASARSTMSWQNVRQRIDGSVPCDEDEVARRARDARGEDLDLGPGDLARAAVGEA